MKRSAALSVGSVAALMIAMSGCTSGASSDPTASATTSASATASDRQAWVRGTKVTLTNSSGATVQYGDEPGAGDSTPTVTYSSLADGKSASAIDDWSATDSSEIFYRVKYSDGKVAEFKVYNPGIGTPGVLYRTGPMAFDWDNASYDSFTLSENESKTVTVAGHSIDFAQGSQDDDNKNWTVTLK